MRERDGDRRERERERVSDREREHTEHNNREKEIAELLGSFVRLVTRDKLHAVSLAAGTSCSYNQLSPHPDPSTASPICLPLTCINFRLRTRTLNKLFWTSCRLSDNCLESLHIIHNE